MRPKLVWLRRRGKAWCQLSLDQERGRFKRRADVAWRVFTMALVVPSRGNCIHGGGFAAEALRSNVCSYDRMTAIYNFCARISYAPRAGENSRDG